MNREDEYHEGVIVQDRHLTREDLLADGKRTLAKLAEPEPSRVFCGVDLWTTGRKCCPDCTHGTGKGDRCEGCNAWGVA